jgi:hypothetical protein
MRSNRGADDLGVETPPPLPFVVPWISAAVGMDRFFGSLTVQSGSITFEPTSRLNKVMTASAIGRIVHTDPGVVVVRARLLPPSLNSSAILRGNGDYGDALSAGVQMATWTRRDLCQALRAAGFRVDERVTWFSLGGSLR